MVLSNVNGTPPRTLQDVQHSLLEGPRASLRFSHAAPQ
eukprot:gene25151-2687_t